MCHIISTFSTVQTIHRVDPTPSGHQKPSFISLGTRARKIFSTRKKAENEEEV